MTLEELYNKVMSDRAIMGEFVKAAGTDTLVDFAGKYGCKATENEIRKCFIAKCGGDSEGEIDDDAAETVAGGMTGFNGWISGVCRSLFGSSVSSLISQEDTLPGAITGGRTVQLGRPVSKDSVVGKGFARASGDVPLSSIYKKL